ncbi:Reticulon [Musa troglodytarum]|nr:Reticulon [Musa troglodytarum]
MLSRSEYLRSYSYLFRTKSSPSPVRPSCKLLSRSRSEVSMAFLLPLTEITLTQNRAAKTLHFRRPSCSGGGDPNKSPSRVCAHGRVKDEAQERVIRVSDPLRDEGVPPLFFVPLLDGASSSPLFPSVSPQQQQTDGGDEKQDYYVNMGYAIRTLREEFPDIFQREPNYDIYRDDIVFKDPLNTFVGINNYKRIFWALRLNGRVFFKAIWINIVSIWQPGENVIMIRWIVHGIPRVPWEIHGRFDGTSEYKLDKTGKIYEHRVDNVALNTPTKFRVLLVEELIQSLGCPSTPKPTYFETSLLSVISCLPSLLRFSWIRCYMAFYIVLAFRCTGKD